MSMRFSRSTFRNIEYAPLNEAMARPFFPTTFSPAPLPVKPPTTIRDLPQGEQLALLKLRRNEICGAVYEQLIENGACHPDRRCFAPLVAEGYAIKKANGFHDITPRGMYAANELATILARELSVHCLIEGSSIRAETSFKCSCGKWSTTLPRCTHATSNARRAFARHLATVEGTERLRTALKPLEKSEAT